MLLVYAAVFFLVVQPLALAAPMKGAAPTCGFGISQCFASSPFKTKTKEAEAVCPEIAKHNMEVANYCNKAVANAKSNTATTVEITRLDAANMKTLAAMENARNPGLNLVYIEDRYPESLLLSIKKAETEMPKPSTIRFIFPPTPISIHRSFAEVKMTDSGTSVVIFDSTLPHDDMQLQSAVRLLTRLYKVSVVAPQIQRSTQDCVMFSLHFALKSFKTGFGEEINDSAFPVNIGRDQRDQIFAVFFKHSQTSQITDHLDANVDKQGTQTLKQRLEACRATRYLKRFEITSSVSIEAFRLQEIRRVVDAFDKGSGGFNRSLERLYVPWACPSRHDG